MSESESQIRICEDFSQIARANIESLLKQLNIDEKIALLSGNDFWHTVPIKRLGIPSVRLSDGPNGVRGTRFFGSIPSACLPCGTGIGATFDKDLSRQIGHLLGDEAKAKGAHVVLGPTINIPRGPLGGRGFESFSEDPLLSGVIAGHYCQGLKDKNIIATPKHFVCNDQEHERMAVNSIVTDRAMREIYLLPFMIAIRLGKPEAIMTAYNKVNGTHASESLRLIGDILRGEWAWDGLVMSDWFGTYSTSEAIVAGLDLEMPGSTRWRGSALNHAVASNKISKNVLDSRVREVLKLVQRASKSGIAENAPEIELNRDEDKKLLRKVASDAIVLLKNADDVLPLNTNKRVAVIGPNSKIAAYSGGGSATLKPYEAVTPFDGIAGSASAGVDFAQGVYAHQLLPVIGKQLHKQDGRIGFTLKFFNDAPGKPNRELLEERDETDFSPFFLDYNHPNLRPIWYADAEGNFTPDESGIYDFGLCVRGTGKLYVDGKLLINNADEQQPGSSFLGTGTVEEKGTLKLEARQTYRILVEWGSEKTSKIKVPGVVYFGHGGFRLGVARRISPEEGIEAAVKLASETDQVVLFAGLSAEWESEGEDRLSMKLPPHSDELISRVLDANSNTVVIIQSGTPVEMPWIAKAKSVVQAWYGGNECGRAIADIIFGDTNPSGKLPLTFPRTVKQNPTYLNYRSEGGRVLYGEDVYVGYRYYDELELEPLFPFGHGLSYTTFELSSLDLKRSSETELEINVFVKNTGPRAGAEVVQIYVAPVSPPIKRPVKELKEFAKVFIEAGSQKLIKLNLELVRATSFWDEKASSWRSEADTYKILVGTSSRGKFLEGDVVLKETTYWSGL